MPQKKQPPNNPCGAAALLGGSLRILSHLHLVHHRLPASGLLAELSSYEGQGLHATDIYVVSGAAARKIMKDAATSIEKRGPIEVAELKRIYGLKPKQRKNT